MDVATEQQTCPPCRQSLSLYERDVWVTRGTARIDVCCPGCADKMVGDWDGYLAILTGLGERPAQAADVGGDPVTSNEQQRPVCLPCSGGLCMLPEHLPPASDG
jgi:hypothetical protein